MGCCMSHCSFSEKETVYEVTLDANGVAQRVPKGQGTHFIHISPHKETLLKEKSDITAPSPTYHHDKWPSMTAPIYNQRVHPMPEKIAA
ncbi:hypothetical protein RMCBS344292_06691 [Rhizopus microsporus]|nr:hypothetical protein RMCBS344292_06691 [Rhizopus microsporus]